MKKLLSTILIGAMSICFFGSVSCFAEKPTCSHCQSNKASDTVVLSEKKIEEISKKTRSDLVSGAFKGLFYSAEICAHIAIYLSVGALTKIIFDKTCPIDGTYNEILNSIIDSGKLAYNVFVDYAWLAAIFGGLAL